MNTDVPQSEVNRSIALQYFYSYRELWELMKDKYGVSCRKNRTRYSLHKCKVVLLKIIGCLVRVWYWFFQTRLFESETGTKPVPYPYQTRTRQINIYFKVYVFNPPLFSQVLANLALVYCMRWTEILSLCIKAVYWLVFTCTIKKSMNALLPKQ